MVNTGEEIIDWLKGYKFGVSFSDKFTLFFAILNKIIILAILYIILGKEKTSKSILSKPGFLSWLSNKKVNVNLDGILLSLPLALDYLWLVKSDWELEEKEFMKKSARSEGIILDIGSNIGYHTIMLAKSNPNSKIFSIEASPTIFNTLKENCMLNRLQNIIFFNNAVTDQNDEIINFYKRDTMSTTDKTILEDWLVPENEIKIEKTKTITLDSLLEREGIRSISLLKMDIEGAEVLAFEGAKFSLETKKIQNMIIEYHSYSNRDYLLDKLNDYGFETSVHKRPILYENKDHANGHIFAVSK